MLLSERALGSSAGSHLGSLSLLSGDSFAAEQKKGVSWKNPDSQMLTPVCSCALSPGC